jgi:hypothetical protein
MAGLTVVPGSLLLRVTSGEGQITWVPVHGFQSRESSTRSNRDFCQLVQSKNKPPLRNRQRYSTDALHISIACTLLGRAGSKPKKCRQVSLKCPCCAYGSIIAEKPLVGASAFGKSNCVVLACSNQSIVNRLPYDPMQTVRFVCALQCFYNKLQSADSLTSD